MLKKDLISHLIVLFGFFFFVSLFRGWLSFLYLPFWLGGVFGSILPHADHYVNIYFVNPDTELSRYAKAVLSQRSIRKFIILVHSTTEQQKGLIFHTVLFQVLFVIFAFLIVTSTASLFGRGLVFGFLIHLLVDEVKHYKKFGNLDAWMENINFKLDVKDQMWYMVGNGLVLLIFGFLL